MSDTKIAASFRVSVTTRVPRQPESPVAWPWLHFHVALGSCAAAGSAARCSVANLAALAGAYHASGRIAPEAREALQRHLALPSTGPFKTIAAFEAYYSAQGGDPPRVEMNERVYDGLRKAGMPEGRRRRIEPNLPAVSEGFRKAGFAEE